MKLIIDIPKSIYANIKKIQHGSIASKRILDVVKKGKPYTEFGTYIDGYIKGADVLDKIRAEIENIAYDWQEIDGEHESRMVVDLDDALWIIDKYKAESEVQE